MADALNGIEDAFQSTRLQYLRVDEFDAGFKAFVPRLVHDPTIQAFASPLMLQPKCKKDFDSYVKSVASSLLGVAVCLRPDEEQRRRKQPQAEGQDLVPLESRHGTNSNQEKPEESLEPTIIGVMCLGWGGISHSVAHHRNAHIGISLVKPYQDSGYGREAINWMLDWAFRHGGLHSVGICAASYNPRAIHLYQALGFTLEGRRREVIWFNRGWHDELDFGMTEKEWEELRGLNSA